MVDNNTYIEKVVPIGLINLSKSQNKLFAF